MVRLGRILTLGGQTECMKAQGLGTNVSSLQEVRVQEMGARLPEAAVSSGSGGTGPLGSVSHGKAEKGMRVFLYLENYWMQFVM